ncbi:MAG: transcriptional repressor [Chloroflexi bacterium]|nr:MAG: transcriptional repressor [Chloroflexota bacterium]TMG40049.1 MAG: transcriptional repressor [Chloroflexota bacterium]
MSPRATATEALQSSGYRLTMQRQLVWDALRQSKRHLSAEDISALLRKRHPRLNLATVYRSLEVLEELGLIKQTRIGDRGYYELVQEGKDHYHLVCDRCGSTLHIEGDHMVPVLHHITEDHDFMVSAADLVVHGRCAKCQAKAAHGGEGRWKARADGTKRAPYRAQ